MTASPTSPGPRVAMMVSGNRVEDVRIVAGAVQCIPRRLHEAEDLVRGSDRSEEVAAEAGAVAVRGARTLNHNHFKVPLLERLVARAVREA